MYWLNELLSLLNVSPASRLWIERSASLFAILLPIPVIFAFMKWKRPRQTILPPYRERVLILGASSGVGRELALAYANRGCRQLVIVGRREKELQIVAVECDEERKKGEEWDMSDEAPGYENVKSKKTVAITADCSNAEDIVRIREECRKAFEGIDTVHICFGVSALRPLLGIPGVDPIRPMKRADLLPNLPQSSKTNAAEADVAGILVTQEATRRINEVNITGTSMVLSAFLPFLQMTSPSPSIHLLSSAAAVIPAPTRPLYGASKAAQLILFQATAIEAAAQAKHSRKEGSLQKRAHVRFYASVPGTILSNFRASAVDGSPDEISAFDSSWNVKGGGKSDAILPKHLAQHVILAVDQYKEGTDEIPFKYWAARRAFPFAPGLLARMASKKYAYN
ncbi:NAD(P)-binding protein [Meira miltonrushii]|uniref:NAD(P)-binding protein n=1 Tax=Meira miltonrushii TaxID=1280837 RepID=A0A316VPR9_9BASI|nr:NAD(P)-binding protein [Meira miltonrushii]PWN38413.1 NAD(P)-binding protein [Meira miltonrushii]